MAEPFIGEIRMFGGNFAPRNWAFCNGQLLAISQNDALFALMGTRFGGDGRTTFGLPDLRGRIPLGDGNDLQGNTYALGQSGGVERVTLNAANMPLHTHNIAASDQEATMADPSDGFFAKPASTDETQAYAAPSSNVALSSSVLASTGSSTPLNNMQPYNCLNFIIALQGIFPSRN